MISKISTKSIIGINAINVVNVAKNSLEKIIMIDTSEPTQRRTFLSAANVIKNFIGKVILLGTKKFISLAKQMSVTSVKKFQRWE